MGWEFYQMNSTSLQAARQSCGGEYRWASNAHCANSLQAIQECTRGLNNVHVLEPACEEYPSLTIDKQQTLQDHGRKMLTQSAFSSVCRNATYFLSELWTNDQAVRGSLGIHKGTIPSWQRCNVHLPYTYEITSTVDDHAALITRGYRAMIYSGDHDCKVSYIDTQAWIRRLKLPITDRWRPWHVDDQIVG